MKTLIIVLCMLVILFVVCTETYIRIHREIGLLKRCILVAICGIILITEFLHFGMLGMMIIKVATKDYDLIEPPTSVMLIDDYNHCTGTLYYTKNGASYMGHITSTQVNVEFTDDDVNSATFYDAKYRVWIYTVPTTVCKIKISRQLL